MSKSVKKGKPKLVKTVKEFVKKQGKYLVWGVVILLILYIFTLTKYIKTKEINQTFLDQRQELLDQKYELKDTIESLQEELKSSVSTLVS